MTQSDPLETQATRAFQCYCWDHAGDKNAVARKHNLDNRTVERFYGGKPIPPDLADEIAAAIEADDDAWADARMRRSAERLRAWATHRRENLPLPDATGGTHG